MDYVAVHFVVASRTLKFIKAIQMGDRGHLASAALRRDGQMIGTDPFKVDQKK